MEVFFNRPTTDYCMDFVCFDCGGVFHIETEPDERKEHEKFVRGKECPFCGAVGRIFHVCPDCARNISDTRKEAIRKLRVKNE